MIFSEPTTNPNLKTFWLYAQCDHPNCGVICDFEACTRRRYHNPKGGFEVRPEGCRSEYTRLDDPIFNDFVEYHAVVCHGWRLFYDEAGKRTLLCPLHPESEA